MKCILICYDEHRFRFPISLSLSLLSMSLSSLKRALILRSKIALNIRHFGGLVLANTQKHDMYRFFQCYHSGSQSIFMFYSNNTNNTATLHQMMIGQLCSVPEETGMYDRLRSE